MMITRDPPSKYDGGHVFRKFDRLARAAAYAIPWVNTHGDIIDDPIVLQITHGINKLYAIK